VVKLTVTDDSEIVVFQQMYKIFDVQRLNGLCNVVGVMSRSKFEKECGKNKKLTLVGGLLECEEQGDLEQDVTETRIDGHNATREYAEWKKRNVGVHGLHPKVAVRLKMVEKTGLRAKTEEDMNLDA
jgi:hypothetical protein